MPFWDKRTAQEKFRDNENKAEARIERRKARHKENLRLAKLAGKKDAQKRTRPLTQRIGGALSGFSSGIEALNRGSDSIAEQMFGPNTFGRQQKPKKQKKKVRRRVTEYY